MESGYFDVILLDVYRWYLHLLLLLYFNVDYVLVVEHRDVALTFVSLIIYVRLCLLALILVTFIRIYDPHSISLDLLCEFDSLALV